MEETDIRYAEFKALCDVIPDDIWYKGDTGEAGGFQFECVEDVAQGHRRWSEAHTLYIKSSSGRFWTWEWDKGLTEDQDHTRDTDGSSAPVEVTRHEEQVTVTKVTWTRFDLAERQAAPANLESVAQPDTPDAHVGERSAYVNDLEFQRSDAVRDVERLRGQVERAADIEDELRQAANNVLYQWSMNALGKPAIDRLSKAVSASFQASVAALEATSSLLREAHAKLERVEAVVHEWKGTRDIDADEMIADLDTALAPILGAVAAVESGESGA